MTLIEAIKIAKKMQICHAANVPCELIGRSLLVKDKMTCVWLTADLWTLNQLRSFVK